MKANSGQECPDSPSDWQGGCGRSNEKCSPWAHVFEHMVPNWGHCLGRLWNLEEMELCWEKFVIGGGLWPSALQDRLSPHFFLIFILYSYVYGERAGT